MDGRFINRELSKVGFFFFAIRAHTEVCEAHTERVGILIRTVEGLVEGGYLLICEPGWEGILWCKN